MALVHKYKWNVGVIGGSLGPDADVFVLVPRRSMRVVARRSR
jgi:hypothetical protein